MRNVGWGQQKPKAMTKTSTLITATLFASILLFGCKNSGEPRKATQEKTEMSSEEKETAKREISARVDEIVKGANSLNVDAAIKPYSNEADFKIVNPDASLADYQTMKNTQNEAFKTLASMNFKTIKQDFTFLETDLVMCTWTGSNEFELKSGEKMKIEPYVGSMLFRKRNNEWSIVYAHETAAPPVTIR